MWAAAAALQHSTGSRRVLGWDGRRQEAAKASCRSPGSGGRQTNYWVGNCQRIHEEWGTAASTSSLDQMSHFLSPPQFSPELQQSNVSCISAREQGSPRTSSSHKLAVLPFPRKEFGLLPVKKRSLLSSLYTLPFTTGFPPAVAVLALHNKR